jgi:hypothetical protein
MKLLRSVLALGIIAGFVLCATSGQALAQKKKGQVGKVVELKDDSVTIAFKAKKDDTEVTKKTYKTNKDTKYQNAPKEKGGEPTSAKAEDVKKDSFIRIETAPDSDVATIITILPAKKPAAN